MGPLKVLRTKASSAPTASGGESAAPTDDSASFDDARSNAQCNFDGEIYGSGTGRRPIPTLEDELTAAWEVLVVRAGAIGVTFWAGVAYAENGDQQPYTFTTDSTNGSVIEVRDATEVYRYLVQE
jgi:hypothetical protein